MSGFLDQANRTPVTFIILLAYVTMAILTKAFESDDKFVERLIAYGADVGILVQGQGELWRLFTHAFLHGGFLHLALNSYFLFVLGPQLEESLGSPRFTLVYVVAAVAGGANGNLWHHPVTPLVGGSGALFGLMGAALALSMRRGRHLLDFMNYVGPRQLVGLLVVNLIIGLMIPIISNAGHLGGLVAGFVLTFCFLERGREVPDRVARVIQAAWLAVFASLIFYTARPVVRWDYLATQYERQLENGDREKAGAFARALLQRDPAIVASFEGPAAEQLREAARWR